MSEGFGKVERQVDEGKIEYLSYTQFPDKEKYLSKMNQSSAFG